MVEAGTVHRYQGDEKHVMILDIPTATANNALASSLTPTGSTIREQCFSMSQ